MVWGNLWVCNFFVIGKKIGICWIGFRFDQKLG